MQHAQAGAPVRLPASPGQPAVWGAPWDAAQYPPPQQQWGAAPTWATPPPTATGPRPLAHAGSGPAIFCTEAALTLDSGSPTKDVDRWSPGSVTGGPRSSTALQHPPAPPAFQQQLQQPSGPAGDARLQRLEAQNAELQRACQELQARLEAAAAAASPPPPASTQQRPAPGEEADPTELRVLERRLAAKGREAAAAAQAAEAAQAALAAKEVELEAERQRAAALADEVARWKDECVQKEREARGLAQRLEAAAAQCGLLDDSVAALKKRAGELGTALAQRDVAVRQLEDRLRALQGSEGSRDRQLEAAQSEADAARGERDALRRQCADLQQRNGELESEVRRLGAALQQADKERAAVLRSCSRDLELIAAVPSQQQQQAAERGGSSSGSPPLCPADRYSTSPGAARSPPAVGYVAAGYAAQPPAQHHWGSHYGEPAAASFAWASSGQPPSLDPCASLPQQRYTAAGPPAWQPEAYQQQFREHAVQPQETSYHAGGGGQHGGARTLRHTASDDGRFSARAASDARSDGGYAVRAPRPPTALQQAWEERGSSGGCATPSWQQQQQQRQRLQGPGEEALAGQLSGLALHTPTASATSPFATEDTLQDMLARTQALEDALLALNAEKNELEAEAARMPSHTTGRTVQERRRRAEVEARLEAIGRECSAVRLQLRRLGVK